MLRSALLVFLFTAHPAWADDLWKEACEKDLSEVAEWTMRIYNVSPDFHPFLRAIIYLTYHKHYGSVRLPQSPETGDAL